MTQVTFDLVEFQQPVESYIDHAQASLKTQETKHARHGISAAASALALINLVMPRLGGHDLALFQEFRRQVQALMIEFWKDFGLIYLQRANEPEAAVVRKVVHIDGNGQMAEKPPVKPGKRIGKPRGRAVAHEVKMRIGELANSVPEGVGIEKWFGTVAEENGISSISAIYAYRQYYREHRT